MPELFKLEKEEFSEVYNEHQWTYSCLFEFLFNFQSIRKITITDHIWRKKGREWITKKLVLDILWKHLNGEIRRPKKKHGNREIFVEEMIPYENKHYLLVFWFENNDPDWLWIRNCYPIN